MTIQPITLPTTNITPMREFITFGPKQQSSAIRGSIQPFIDWITEKMLPNATTEEIRVNFLKFLASLENTIKILENFESQKNTYVKRLPENFKPSRNPDPIRLKYNPDLNYNPGEFVNIFI